MRSTTGLTAGLLVLTAALLTAQTGRFVGTVQAEWLDDGRQMRLLADFAYIDPEGTQWSAPRGSVVDGASIPPVFWSHVGGPFEGKYRIASVVHDVACQERKASWLAVHRMFYHASRAAGVGDAQALIMYSAVYHFGPRWAVGPTRSPSDLNREDFERLQELIERDPTMGPEQIETISRTRLRQAVPKPKRSATRPLPPP